MGSPSGADQEQFMRTMPIYTSSGSEEEFSAEDFDESDALYSSTLGPDMGMGSRHEQTRQLIVQLSRMIEDPALISDKQKRLDTLHKVTNEIVDRDFKLEIYQALGEYFDVPANKAEQYGREHFADDLSVLQRVLLQWAQ